MKTTKDVEQASPMKRKSRSAGLKADEGKLREIVEVLSKNTLTKKELADLIGVEKSLLTEGVFLAAAKLTKNIKFMESLGKESPGRTETSPKYVEKKGLLIQPSHFKNRGMVNGQKFSVQIGKRGIITLRPTEED